MDAVRTCSSTIMGPDELADEARRRCSFRETGMGDTDILGGAAPAAFPPAGAAAVPPSAVPHGPLTGAAGVPSGAVPTARAPGGALAGGLAGVNARTRERATAKLPPSLQAKLAAVGWGGTRAYLQNAQRSAMAGTNQTLGAGEKLDPSLLMSKHARPPPPAGDVARSRPRPGLRLSDIGVDASASSSAKPARAGGRAKLSLGMLPSVAEPMNSPFSHFSKIVDPSGRLRFEGKAVLHASGVEFKNGTSFNINMDELEMQEQLGHGNYGTVTKVRHTRTGVEMAMKEIRLELDQTKLNAIIMELDILHRAIAPQIVEFYGAFFVESCVYYCMEFMDMGSLDKLCAWRHCMLPEAVLARIAASTVKGLHFLKDQLQIIHRDVKPTNILLNNRGEIKLCDFGVSGQLEKSLAKTNIGCQSYMAPERIKGDARDVHNTYTTASDVWSLGLSLVEVTMGTYPYPPETFSNVFAQLQAIVDGPTPELPYPSPHPIVVTSSTGEPITLELGTCEYSATARDFVAQCLRKIPDERPSYAELLKHPLLVGDETSGVDMAAWVARASARHQPSGRAEDGDKPTAAGGQEANASAAASPPESSATPAATAG